MGPDAGAYKKLRLQRNDGLALFGYDLGKIGIAVCFCQKDVAPDRVSRRSPDRGAEAVLVAFRAA